MNPEQPTADAGFDFKELFARLEHDRDLLHDVFQIYIQEYPRLYLLLQDSISRGELRQVEIHAHTLKGMLASLSFRSASDSAMRIERMARLSDLSSMPAEVIRLERNAVSAQVKLEQCCALAA